MRKLDLARALLTYRTSFLRPSSLRIMGAQYMDIPSRITPQSSAPCYKLCKYQIHIIMLGSNLDQGARLHSGHTGIPWSAFV